jgi:hypothetical protein
MRALVALLVVVALGVLGLQVFGVEALLRRAVGRLQERTGVVVDFTGATGSLLDGTLTLEGLTAVLERDGVRALDVKAARFEAQAPLTSLGEHPLQFRRVEVTGLEGSADQPPRREGEAAEVRRDLATDLLRVEDSRVESTRLYLDGKRRRTEVEVTRLEIQGYRSDWAMHDFLFHSSFEGKLDGGPFTITRTLEGGEWRVTWDIQGLPKEPWTAEAAPDVQAAGFLGGGRTLDVEVVSRWHIDAPETIHMAWTIVTPEQPISFECDMAREKFRGVRSLRESGVMEHVRQAILNAVGDRVEDAVAGIRDRLRDAMRGR